MKSGIDRRPTRCKPDERHEQALLVGQIYFIRKVNPLGGESFSEVPQERLALNAVAL
jgi:hypothetical protein